MDEHVRLELAHEEQRERTRITGTDDAGVHRAAEVVGDDGDRTARRTVVRRGVEGDDQRGLPRRQVHLHRDRGADDAPHERNHLFRESAQHDARILGRIRAGELLEKDRHADLRAHGAGEEILLRRKVPQDRGRRHADALADVRERRPIEAPSHENGSRSLEDLIAVDARRASHS